MVTNSGINLKTAASGKLVQAQGVGVANDFTTATYPSTAGSSGKILISDGTNIISSTPTYPNAAGTAGNLLVSDGTNWVSQTPSAAQTVTVTLTNAQLKAMNTTPIVIVPAPGANKIIFIIGFYVRFNYGGTNPFTNTSNLDFQYGSAAYNAATLIINAIPGANMAGSSTIDRTSVGSTSAINTQTKVNTDVCISAAANQTGNAANNNTVFLSVDYAILSTV